MMSELSIVEFSRYPAGRTDNDGPNNGSKFRNTVLVPALNRAGNGKVRIVLDGARTYGSSFLEEAFGGLVRSEGFSAEELRERLEIVVKDPSYQIYRNLIFRFISEAAKQAH